MKSRKEKILLGTLIAMFIALGVLLYFWTVSVAQENANDTLGIITLIVYFAMLYVNVKWQEASSNRRIQETQDKIMDMIIEFSKENKTITMEVEKGLGKTKNYRKK